MSSATAESASQNGRGDAQSIEDFLVGVEVPLDAIFSRAVGPSDNLQYAAFQEWAKSHTVEDVKAIAAEVKAAAAEEEETHADAEAAERFDFEELGEIAEGGIPDPPLLAPHLYEKRVHWYAGHPGHGKTTKAANDAVAHMSGGGHVVWLDWEAGIRPTVARLLAAGATVAQLADQFHLVVGAPLQATEDGFTPLASALEDFPGALVVFDSASKALSAAGFDENSATDATKWTTNIILPCREAGATVIVIDHVVKGATKSTPYARGAGSKLADTDVAWYVEKTVNFDRETVGRIELTRHKDREGLLPERLAFEVGDGGGMLPLTAVEVEDEGSRSKREKGLRSSVLMALQKHAVDGKKLSGSQVVGMTKGKESAIREALRELASDRQSAVCAEPAERNTILYSYDPDAAVNRLEINEDEDDE